MALFAVTALIFLPALRNGFVKFDDDWYLTANPHVQAGLTWAGLRWALTTSDASNYWHPLTWLSHMLDWQLFGPRAWGHHLVGLLLHAATAALLFAWLDEAAADRPRALIAAALFALHPLRVESVAWAAERKDVLCGLFFISACWAHTRGARLPALLFALGALASKPMAVTLPAALLLLDRWPLRRTAGFWTLVREKLPLIVSCVAVTGVTLVVQLQAGSVATVAQEPLVQRVGTAAVNVLRYLRMTAWPSGLIPFYPLEAPPAWEVALAFAVLAVVSWLSVRAGGAVLVGWAWFLLLLLPVVGLVQAGLHGVADRYTYLPHVGLFIAIAWALPDLRWTRAAAGVAATALAVCTFRLVPSWKDPETLFGRVLRLSPDNPMGNLAVAVERMQAGRLPEAERLLRRAVAREPQLGPGWANLASAVAAQGRVEEALPLYARAAALVPADAEVAAAYGKALARTGHADEALVQLGRAYRQQPDLPGLALSLGSALARRGQPQAVAVLERAVAEAPLDASAHTALGAALAQAGRFGEAIRELERALQLDPNSPGAREMLRLAGEDQARQR